MIKPVGNTAGIIAPKNKLNVSICSHRHDAVCSWSQETDTLNANTRYAAELFGFKYNLGLSAFINPVFDSADLAECEATGRIKFDVYFTGWQWKNPVTDAIEMIPDYDQEHWTSAGKTYFPSVTVGASKTVNYPNHGQEMYDVSGGEYGYDFDTDTAGSSNLRELYGVADYLKGWFDGIFGRKPAAISYASGKTDFAQLLKGKFLAGRNSDYSKTGDALTAYGAGLGLPNPFTLTQTEAIAKKSSTRWWDSWNGGGLTEVDATAYANGELAKTLANHGFYNDFMHWHNLSDNKDKIEAFFSAQKTTMGTGFVFTGGYGEVMEYFFLREMTRLCSYESGSEVVIIARFINKDSVPLDVINTPLSLKINLTGTVLEGKDIKSDSGDVIKISTNNFIVDAPLDSTGCAKIVLSEDASPAYLDFAKPSIISAVVVGTTLTVTTDAPTRLAIFIAERNASENTAVLLSRCNTLSTSHTATVSLANQAKDIYIGAITKEKQSVLSNVYRFI